MKNKGQILPLAILIMLLSAGLIISMMSFLSDKTKSNTNLASIAQTHAENALVYAVHVSNTKNTETGTHGRKCSSDTTWFSGNEIEITNEDEGLTEITIPNSQGNKQTYKVKRFVKMLNSESYDTTVQGIGRIYDNNTLIAEKAVEMHVNLYFINNSSNATDKCNASAIQMFKNTWRIVK